MRTKYHEYNRVQEIHIRKKCEWHISKIYSEISVTILQLSYRLVQFTNIQKKFFKKKDFMPSASRPGLKKELKDVKQAKSPKTDTKASNEDDSSDDEEDHQSDHQSEDESKDDDESGDDSDDRSDTDDNNNDEHSS